MRKDRGHYDILKDIVRRVTDLEFRRLEDVCRPMKITDVDEDASRSDTQNQGKPAVRAQFSLNNEDLNVLTPFTIYSQGGWHGNLRTHYPATAGSPAIGFSYSGEMGTNNTLLIPGAFTMKDGEQVKSLAFKPSHPYGDQWRFSIENIQKEPTLRAENPLSGAKPNDTKAKRGPYDCRQSSCRAANMRENVNTQVQTEVKEQTKEHDETYDADSPITRNKKNQNVTKEDAQTITTNENTQKQLESVKNQLSGLHDVLVQDKSRNVSTEKMQIPDLHKITSKDGLAKAATPLVSALNAMLGGAGGGGGGGGGGQQQQGTGDYTPSEPAPVEQMTEPPTDELWDRPTIWEDEALSPDDGLSPPDLMTRPFVVADAGEYAVIPRIYDASDHTEEEAEENYNTYHHHCGKFSTQEAAEQFITWLRQEQTLYWQYLFGE